MADAPVSQLNEAQRLAVEHREGPLRIVAGAGAGKTHTLTQSVLALIKSGAARPEQILALTFTRKAAEELRERMGKAVRALDPNLGEVDIDTYNAFGGRIVAQHGHKIGLPPDPTILSTSDAWILLWRVLDRIEFQTMDWTWPRGNGFGGSPLRTIIETGSRLRDELRDPSDLAELLEQIGDDGDNPDLADVCRALTVYDQRKFELGAIDYGDQIALACQLLEWDEVRDFYGGAYRFMMVDEFQDTNYAQRVMVRRLGTALDANIRVVGDPNQAIYSFRGAAPDNLERFIAEDFPEAETIPLTANYRSTIRILDFANALWDVDPGDYRGNLEAAGGVLGEKVVLAACVAFVDEAAWIAGEIGRLHATGTSYRDIAILVRKNTQKRLLHRALIDHGLPVEVVGGSSLYEQPEVRLLISALRVVAGEPDDTSFAHILSSDRWGVDEASLYAIARERARDESLVDACRRIARRGGDDGAEMLARFMESLDDLVRRAYLSTLPSLVDRIASDLLGALDPVPAANVARFRRMVQQFSESQIQTPSLKELVVYLDLLLSASPEDEAVSEVELGEADTVKLMTFHAAKGLEWPVVFVATANSRDLTQSRPQRDMLVPELVRASRGRPERIAFPPGPAGRAAFVEAVRAWDASRALEEERRVLYVALTRARDRLYLSWSANNPTRKGKSELAPMIADLADYCECIQPPPAAVPDPNLTMEAFARRSLPALNDFLADIDTTSASTIAPVALIAGDWERIGGSPGSLPFAFSTFVEQRERVKADLAFIADIAERTKAARAALLDAPTRSITYSQIETYRTCPHRYHLRHVVGLPGMPEMGEAATYGTSVHEAIARDGVARSRGEPGGIPARYRPQSPSANGGGASTSSGSLDPVECYLQSDDARCIPVLVEEPFTFAVGSATVNGVIDRVHRRPDGSLEVVDYKTDWSVRTPEQVRAGLQLQTYLLALRHAFPDLQPAPKSAAMFFLRWNERVELEFTEADLAEAEAHLLRFAEAMNSVPADLHSASPETCRFCEFRLTCRFSMARVG